MAMGGAATDYQVGLWVAALCADPLYASLHTGDPRVGGSATELQTGGSYTRQEFSFVSTGPRSCANSEQCEWTIPEVVTLTHVGVYDDDTAGELRIVVPLPEAITVVANKLYVVASGALYVRW